MYQWNELFGHELEKKYVKAAMQSKRISHAYLISGIRGVGKKTFANTFAKALFCEAGMGQGCGTCASCHAFETGNHPDLFYVRPHKTKTIGVEDVREKILHIVPVKPYRYDFKVFIVEQADKLTVQAQNALLKTLEDPPPYAVFLLLAENKQQLVAPFLSRCAPIALRPLKTIEVTTYLEAHFLQEQAHVLAQFAQGSIGMALELSQSESFGAMREDIIQMLVSIRKLDLVRAMGLAKELEKYKDNRMFLDIAYLWYRDLMVVKKLQDKKYVIQTEKQQLLQKEAAYETLQGLAVKLQAIFEAGRQLEQNTNFLLTMEMMLMKIKEN